MSILVDAATPAPPSGFVDNGQHTKENLILKILFYDRSETMVEKKVVIKETWNIVTKHYNVIYEGGCSTAYT